MNDPFAADVQRQRRTTLRVRSRLLANVCGERCVQSQVLPNVRGRSRTQMVTVRTAVYVDDLDQPQFVPK